MYAGRLALFGESALGFLKRTTKGSPQWTRGIWLGKTMSNDVHIIAVSGSIQLFVTRSVRRFPKPWNMDGIASVEACPWSFGYASLGSQLVLAKRVSAPPILPLPEVKPRDLDAEAVMNVPPTPVEQEDGPQPTRPVAAVVPPVSSVLAPDVFAEELETQMEVSAEAGIPLSVGLEVPSTPMTPAPLPLTMPSSSEPSSASGHAGTSLPASGVHGREGASDVDEANRPTKQARIMAVFEHEDDMHPLHFQDGDVDTLELYEYEMEEESCEGAATDVASDNVLKRLSVPHRTFEPELDPSTLLQLDLLADELEISRLKAMGVLIPAESYDVAGQTPKKLTTRMVRTWRDKHLDGEHVWLRRSRYVAREYAWLSPERQDLFSPASSVLTVRLLPCLFMKWKMDDYVLCSIDITDAFLMVDQRELTQVVCEDAGGNVSHYILGKVLPGQRNGSQMWHESFSSFLREDLRIVECAAYPCLLRSETTENHGRPACLLLLHVDDVLCLCKRSYLESVLLPALKARYKISHEMMAVEGDELTFLKRRHMLMNEFELAIQSHPKHLEKLFELLKIGRGLKPKKTPVHPMLDEDDKTEMLDNQQASIYRSCIGILLYVTSDFVEWQYAIRGLSQSMSKPTKQSMECLRYLCTYLLGCTDQCLMLKYESHQGLLHYNPEDYTLEIFSDSDWAKHRTTRRSVSAGYLFMFGNLLYSSSRSQKALALSSCEAEVYAGTSATSDMVLMYHCICFCVGPNETVKVKLALDNAAGRSFFHRSGVERIRHISLRVLWMQQKVFLSVGPVSTKHNPSDLGTKRLNRDRMLYLMFLCKVYDLSTSQYVGSEVNDRLEQETVTRKGIKLFTLAGMNNHDAKALMRVMLISALSLTPATASPAEPMVVDGSYFGFFFAVIVTILCITLGYIALLRKELRELRGEKTQFEWNGTLTKVLKLLKGAKTEDKQKEAIKTNVEGAEEERGTDDESVGETPQERFERYSQSTLDEVSDPGLWQLWHHGTPSATDEPSAHPQYADGHIEQMMKNTNDILRRRLRRLEAEYDAASDANDINLMHQLNSQIDECNGLMYNIG